MSVNHSARSGGKIGISYRFSLTWRYNVYSRIEAILMRIHNIPFSIWKKKTTKQQKKKKTPLIIPNLQLCHFSKGLKNEFETAVVNKPPVFEPLKFHCNCYCVSTPELYQCMKKRIRISLMMYGYTSSFFHHFLQWETLLRPPSSFPGQLKPFKMGSTLKWKYFLLKDKIFQGVVGWCDGPG